MTNYINDETIEKVRDLADIVKVVSDYVPLKKAGANYVGLCPFHNERTPSMTVSESKQIFHCFGCGEGGDSVTFIMKRENLGFPEAIRFLAEKLGVPIEESTPRDPRISQERDKLYEINREAARFFLNNLTKNETALNYLYKRNIGDKLIKQFGLGYSLDSWDSLYKYLSSKGYGDKEIETLGLIGKRSNNAGYYDKFRNRIMYPIIDTRSRVIGFGGRVLDETMPKYLNSQETPIFNKGNHLYGLNLLNKFSDRKRIILVEGYMDVIALFNNKINYGVASLGTALTENQAKLLKRYGENIYICFDSDLAGINATNKAIEILTREDINPKIITLPGYKDPDDYLKAEGLKAFESRINQALNQVYFKIEINKQKYNINESEGKIKFTIEIAKVIKALRSPIEKDVYIDKISKEIGISREAIEKEVFGQNLKKQNNSNNPNNQNYKNQFQQNKRDPRENIYPVKTKLISGNLRAEIDLVKLMVFSKEYYEIIISKIGLDEFENFECKQILDRVKDLYLEEENIDEKLLYSNLKAVPNINLELINTISEKRINFLPENVEQMIEDLINTLNLNKMETKRDNIQKEIEKLEKQQDKDSLEEERLIKLCMELINLNKELNLSRFEDGR